MTEKLKKYLPEIGIGVFLLVNTYLLANEVLYANLLPILLIMVLVALVKPYWLIPVIILSTPLSFNFEDLDMGGVGFYFPTEPMLFGVLLLYLIRLFHSNPVDIRILKHPVSIVIICQLIWIGITAYASSMPMVSVKFLISRMWFVIVLFYLAAEMFRTNQKRIPVFVWLYIIPLAVVIIYTIYNHAQHGFNDKSAHWVMYPFYKDHTSYGAVLAMYIPATIGLMLFYRNRRIVKNVALSFLVLLLIAVVLSYTRAAWVSILGAAGVMLLVLFRIKYTVVLAGIVAFLGLFLIYQDVLWDRLEKNKQDSSSNLSEHVESISNVSSDASNLERLNRWNCALRMWADRPFFGFGPGTYMFQYAPYQSAKDLTIISTNSGDGGNAHSEYLGPLAETGVIGSLLVLILVVMVLKTGLPLFYSLEDLRYRILSLSLVLGLVTYYLHGILNNYLDTDKLSVPFWTFTASLVVLDIYGKKKSTAVE